MRWMWLVGLAACAATSKPVAEDSDPARETDLVADSGDAGRTASVYACRRLPGEPCCTLGYYDLPRRYWACWEPFAVDCPDVDCADSYASYRQDDGTLWMFLQDCGATDPSFAPGGGADPACEPAP